MIEGEEGTIGTASGIVTNALNGLGVSDVTLEIKKGWNSKNIGDVVTTVKTDESGNYNVELPIGNYTVVASKQGFVTNSFNIIVQNGGSTEQNGTITPDGLGNNFRIVLNWGENPEDMDSHLVGTTADGEGYHVYYNDSAVSENDNVVCRLDVDNTESYGPETITLSTTTDNPYYYYVEKFDGTGTTATSEARVDLYQDDVLIKTFNVPTDLGDGDFWNVFAIKNGEIIVSNTITDSENVEYAN